MNQLETMCFLSAQNVLVTEALFRMKRASVEEFDLAVARYVHIKDKLVKSYAKVKPKRESKPRPTHDEVCAFMCELKREDPDGDARWFLRKMEGQGWMNGKQEVKSWKATVANWNEQGFIFPKRGDDKIVDRNTKTRRGMEL